jgi:KaiC/GvpD/RAD55 family RecA-like ATPase
MAKIILSLVRSKNYLVGVAKILKRVNGSSIVYVTTNNLYGTVSTNLKKFRVNVSKIFFIDCISKSINPRIVDEKNCVFIESPGSLSSISIAINSALNNLSGKRVLLLDSLSVLLIYQDANTVSRFSNFILNKMRSLDFDAVILALDTDANKDVLKHVEALADEVIKGG